MCNEYSISVVLPVYRGVSPRHLKDALDSVYSQTYPPVEVIVVEDGPLSPSHHSVLDGFRCSTPPLRRVVLPSNAGAGPANQAGLIAATSEWIAKVDADDISVPERFQLQMQVLQADDCLDLVGSAMLEFVGRPDQITGIRKMPERQCDIENRARINNPVNHPSVIYRRVAALEVGGYRSLPYLEDYDLVARMLSRGARMRNLSEPLVKFRSGPSTINRRRSRPALIAEVALQRNLVIYGMVSPLRAVGNLLVRSGFRLLPEQLVWRIYQRYFLARYDK